MKPEKSSVTRRPLPRGVNLWWHEKKSLWRVGWRDDEGRQHFEYFSAKGRAEDRARMVADTMASRGREGLRATNFAHARDHDRILKAIGPATVDQLLSVWERHKGEVLGGRADLTVTDAIADFLKAKRSEEQSEEAHGHMKKRLARLSAALGNRALVAVTPDDLRAWMDKLREGWAEDGEVVKFEAWTRIHHFKSARAFFRHAVREKWRADNPMDALTAPPKPTEAVAFSTVEEGEKLLMANAHLPVSMRLALEMFAGLRYSGTGRLEENEVDWVAKGIRIPANKSKDKKPHYLEGFPDNLWSWLSPWRGKPEAWVPLTKRMMQEEKSKAFSRAGVVNKGNDLRHSFCTYLIARDKDASKCAFLMQHRSPARLYESYRGASTEAEGKRWFAITRDKATPTELPTRRSGARPGPKGKLVS